MEIGVRVRSGEGDEQRLEVLEEAEEDDMAVGCLSCTCVKGVGVDVRSWESSDRGEVQ